MRIKLLKANRIFCKGSYNSFLKANLFYNKGPVRTSVTIVFIFNLGMLEQFQRFLKQLYKKILPKHVFLKNILIYFFTFNNCPIAIILTMMNPRTIKSKKSNKYIIFSRFFQILQHYTKSKSLMFVCLFYLFSFLCVMSLFFFIFISMALYTIHSRYEMHSYCTVRIDQGKASYEMTNLFLILQYVQYCQYFYNTSMDSC